MASSAAVPSSLAALGVRMTTAGVRAPVPARLLTARPGLRVLARPVIGAHTFHSQRRTAAASARELTSGEVELDEDDDGEFESPTPRKAITFSDTMNEDEGDYFEVDARVEDDTLKLNNPEFNLSQSTIDAVEAKGITQLFAIQAAVLKPVQDGRDVIGRARTGSGKTLAFAIPVVESIREVDRPKRGRPPLCLVLAPTRELAKQVEKEFASVAPDLTCGCFYGGVSIQEQMSVLQRGVDVVVGTPGRVIDLINRGRLDLTAVSHVVLDEADQMLAVGFCEDVEEILTTVPTQRQTLLFSATLPRWVTNITRRFLNNPVTVDTIGESDSGRMSDTITALACQVEQHAKPSMLVDLIAVYGNGQKTIVFTQTKNQCDEVCAGLSRKFAAEALHGDISQMQREKTLNRFRNGTINVLVATDVAARGLDIPNVDLVVHNDLPNDSESFLHRSGRTGRAGRKGTAIALLTPQSSRAFQNILRDTKAKIDMVAPPGPEEVLRAASRQVATRLDAVDPDVIKFFEPAAERLLQVKDPHHCLAASLAALSGFTEVPKPRSLITQETGMQTLRVMADEGMIGSPGTVMGIVKRVMPEAVDSVGRVRMLREGEKQGAAFDLPFESAALMMGHAGLLSTKGITLDVPKSLPMDLYNFDRSAGRGGRGGGRGGRGGRGGGSPAGFANRARRTDRSSSYSRYGDDRSSGGSWGGGYDRRNNDRRSAGGSRYNETRRSGGSYGGGSYGGGGDRRGGSSSGGSRQSSGWGDGW